MPGIPNKAGQGFTSERESRIKSAGANDAITDVKGVRVGHAQLSDGEVQTGVSVVMPYDDQAENALYFYGKHSEGIDSEMTGYQVMDDFALLSSPIFMTNLMSVGRIYNGAISYGFTRGRGLPTDGGWPPIVLGLDDRTLNYMNRRLLTERHALDALAGAKSGPVAQGNVGAGLGAVAFGFKGGCGSASRIVGVVNGDGGSAGGGDAGSADGAYTVGSLVVANYGSPANGSEQKNAYPSLLGVVATDAPLSPSSLNELAANAAQGGKELSFDGKPSGSFTFVSFSTAIQIRDQRDGAVFNLDFASNWATSALMQAARESTRAAVLNALSFADTVTGAGGRTVELMPDKLILALSGAGDE